MGKEEKGYLKKAEKEDGDEKNWNLMNKTEKVGINERRGKEEEEEGIRPSRQ